MFHLKSQNRALSLEMLRYKRQLSEARKELDMIRGKSREMESLVSIIQRAWSQVSYSEDCYYYPLLKTLFTSLHPYR